MNLRPAIVIPILAVVAFVLAIVWSVLTPSVPVNIPEGYSTLPDSAVTDGGQPQQVSNRIVVNGWDTNVEIRDPRNDAETVAMGAEGYAIAGLNKDGQQPFTIRFDADDGSFAVALLKEPLGDTRTQAEQYLLNRLEVSETEACELRVYMGVPVSINQFLSGQNLGLSFCPGAVEL